MEPVPNSPEKISEKIRSGEYFRESRRTYNDLYNDPMAERYFYLALAAISLLIFFIAFVAISNIYPLTPEVPFTYVTQDIDEEFPVITPLAAPNEPPNMALKRYLTNEYVRRRESYDFNTLEVNVRVVRNMSSQALYSAWEKELDPANAKSPIAQFQRHTSRRIRVLSTTPLPDGTYEIAYEATLSGPDGIKKSVHSANIAFRFAEVTVDQTTGKATPVDFQVTDYHTRRMEE